MSKFLTGLLLGIILLPAVLLLISIARFVPITALVILRNGKEVRAVCARQINRATSACPEKSPPAYTGESPCRNESFSRCMRWLSRHSKGKSTWGTTDFYPRVPQFGFEPPTLPDWQIFWVAKNGIRYTGMGGYSPEMSDDRAWSVALFLSRLNSLPPGVAVKWRQKSP